MWLVNREKTYRSAAPARDSPARVNAQVGVETGPVADNLHQQAKRARLHSRALALCIPLNQGVNRSHARLRHAGQRLVIYFS